MGEKLKFSTVAEYIENQPDDTKRTLLALQAIIKKAIPDAQELINYEMPAYALVKDGKRDKQIMIAGYKNFVGFSTRNSILEHFADELTGYKIGKASVQFPNDQPLPEDLIIEIIRFKQRAVIDSTRLSG